MTVQRASARDVQAQSSKKQEGVEEQVEGSADSSVAVPDTDLSTTVGAFQTRFKRNKTEHKRASDVEQELAKKRHAVLLEAMANIRRSIAQVAKIDLGDRFRFSLDMDDWQGWPRLLLKLEDVELPEAEYPTFQVLAHDRLSKASIEIACGGPHNSQKISLTDKMDSARLPAILKKSVRDYLDLTEETIFQAEQAADVENDEGNLDETEEKEFDETQAAMENELSGDLFVEEFEQDFMESLPSLDDVEALPDGEI